MYIIILVFLIIVEGLNNFVLKLLYFNFYFKGEIILELIIYEKIKCNKFLLILLVVC